MADKTERIVIQVVISDDGATATLKSLDGKIKETTVDAKALAAANKEVDLSLRGQTQTINATIPQLKKLEIATDGVSKKSGAAAAATLEMGRAISDAPYGIRGMANNVSQLSSQIAFLSRSTDAVTGKVLGFGGAMKAVWAQVMGPLGILLAIQVLIAAIDGFWGSTKKAEKATDDLGDSFNETTKKAEAYLHALNNLSLKEDERAKILFQLSDLSKDYNRLVEESGGNMDELTKSILRYIVAEKARVRLDKLLVEDMEKRQELDRLNVILQSDNIDAMKGEVVKAQDFFSKYGLNPSEWIITKTPEEIRQDFIENVMNPVKNAIDHEADDIEELLSKIFNIPDPKKDPKKPKKLTKAYKEDVFDLEKEIIGFNQRELLSTIRHEEDKRKAKQEYEIKSLEQKKNEWVEKRRIDKDNYIANLDDVIKNNKGNLRVINDANAKKTAAENRFIEESLDADDKFYEAKSELKEAHDSENFAANQKLLENQRQWNNKRAELEIEYNGWVSENGLTVRLDTFDQQQAELEGQLSQQKAIMDAKNVGTQEKLDAEKEYYRLKNEIQENSMEREMSKEQALHDFKIQMMQSAASALGSLSQLAKKGSAEAKSLALVKIALETGIGFMNGLRIAQESAAAKGPGAAYAFPVFYASQIAAVLAAVNKAKSALSSGGVSGGVSTGGSEGGGGFNPNFNIVGSSGQNQVAQAIAGQTGQNARAYIVWEDIQQAQNIEANTSSASSI